MDNGTMVEAFKYLNYCQLAKSSRVSKRFWNLIRTHRHSLALLYVESMTMHHVDIDRAYINLFGINISPKGYNEWVVRNHYSKQISLEVAENQSSQCDHKVYVLNAEADCEDPKCPRVYDQTTILCARAKLNHENWPLFQHFIRLLTDPFIYVREVELTSKNEVINLLARAINHDRMQCKELIFNLEGNSQKFMSWIKDNVCCDEFQIYDYSHSSCNEEFLDFFMTGARCTSKMMLKHCEPSKVIVEFVQKFMDLIECDEYQVVKSIECSVSKRMQVNVIQVLKRDYAKFIIKEERDEDNHTIDQTFELININIGKKLRLTAKVVEITAMLYFKSYFVLKIENL